MATISPDGRRLYVPGEAAISVIDTARHTVIGDPIKLAVKAVAVSPDGRHLYIVRGGSLSVVDTRDNSTVDVPLSGESDHEASFHDYSIDVSPDGKHVYIPTLHPTYYG